jgi:hypothetical protein
MTGASLPPVPAGVYPGQLAAVGTTAAALGVTDLTDATPATAPDHAIDLAGDLRAAGVRQHLWRPRPAARAPDTCSAPERVTLIPGEVVASAARVPG